MTLSVIYTYLCNIPRAPIYLPEFYTLDILFSSNHNIHKSSYGLCFWASDPLIDRYLSNISIKGSADQKQGPHELL